jgi:2-polyprenyl-3-methyl-5-hydroxy-6-metoxy-1,4-benzoquinol methylase
MSAEQALHERRRLAAEASLGASSDPILAAFEAEVVDRNLGGDALDFGAGRGELVRRLHAARRFRSLTAVDILPPPTASDGIRWLERDLNERTPLPDGAFDLLVSSEVIEHLENPRGLVREWFRLLRPGGTLLFSTPNNESWRSLLALLLRGHFVAFSDTCYPAHITALLRKDLERILGETGFRDARFRYIDNGAVPKFTELQWAKISRGRLRGVRYSDNVLIAARRP